MEGTEREFAPNKLEHMIDVIQEEFSVNCADLFGGKVKTENQVTARYYLANLMLDEGHWSKSEICELMRKDRATVFNHGRTKLFPDLFAELKIRLYRKLIAENHAEDPTCIPPKKVYPSRTTGLCGFPQPKKVLSGVSQEPALLQTESRLVDAGNQDDLNSDSIAS